jgi:hypothetical protein
MRESDNKINCSGINQSKQGTHSSCTEVSAFVVLYMIICDLMSIIFLEKRVKWFIFEHIDSNYLPKFVPFL